MAYQCKQPCLPPPIDVAQCPGDAQDSCTFTDMAHCVQASGCPTSEACSAPDGLSYNARQPCAAPSFGVPLCPMAISIPCASHCLALHTEMCAAPPSVPCVPMMLQPWSPCPEDPQPCSSGTADACAPPSSPPPCGSSCPDSCPGSPEGDGEKSYVFPGSVVCLEPSGSVSVKPGVGSPELESTTMFLSSYKPHFV